MWGLVTAGTIGSSCTLPLELSSGLERTEPSAVFFVSLLSSDCLSRDADTFFSTFIGVRVLRDCSRVLGVGIAVFNWGADFLAGDEVDCRISEAGAPLEVIVGFGFGLDRDDSLKDVLLLPCDGIDLLGMPTLDEEKKSSKDIPLDFEIGSAVNGKNGFLLIADVIADDLWESKAGIASAELPRAVPKENVWATADVTIEANASSAKMRLEMELRDLRKKIKQFIKYFR